MNKVKSMAETVKHLKIEGKVQGVCYRDWMVEEAGKLGVSGWVRNRSDGSVEAVAGGRENDVKALIEACRKGSAAASVTNITATECDEKPAGEFSRRATV